MRTIRLLATLVTLHSTPAAAQAIAVSSAEMMAGALAHGVGGAVTQPGERPYSVRARQVGARVAVDYPELNCGGTWKLVSADPVESRFVEIIEYGANRCINYGIVVLRDLGAGRIAWTWHSDYYGGVAAVAVMQ